jgi:hypothetical protein
MVHTIWDIWICLILPPENPLHHGTLKDRSFHRMPKQHSKQSSEACFIAATAAGTRAIIHELSFWTDEQEDTRAVVSRTASGSIARHNVGNEKKEDENKEDCPELTTLPSMEDCVRFLDRHPLIRQMIGDLIQQEQEQEKMTKQQHESFESAAVEEQQQHQHEEEGGGGGEMIPRMVSISSQEESKQQEVSHDDDDDVEGSSSDISSYSEEAPPPPVVLFHKVCASLKQVGPSSKS